MTRRTLHTIIALSLLLLVHSAVLHVPAAEKAGAVPVGLPIEKWSSPDNAEEMVGQCPPIAFIKRDSYGMTGTNAVMFSRTTGIGAAICVYDPTQPHAGVRTIFETKEGFIFDMSPSYDGKKLVFSYKVKTDRPFHLWEINVNGSGLRQLTDGRYHDVSPVYYPDGRIIFTSSRAEGHSYCQDFLASALHICRADGSDIRRIDFSTICSTSPHVLSDGSILFCSWEYNDKSIFTWQALYSLNPNGRQLKLFHGFTFAVPNAVYGAKQIPGSNKVVATMAGHHRVPIGDLVIIDRGKGLEARQSMKRLTRATPWRITQAPKWYSGHDSVQHWQHGDILYPYAYTDPFPVTEHLVLASYQGASGGRANRHHKLVLLKHDGSMATLLELPNASCFCAVPLNPRPLPRVIPGDVPTEPGEGRFFVQDLYQGLLEQGVKRGQVKRLRVMTQPQKKYNTEGPRYHDHYPLVGQGSYYIKQNLGTVPVDEGGSAYFTVPSNVELYFIALDEDGKEIQRMGAVTQITTGETASCVGCHDDRRKTPPVTKNAYELLAKDPDKITPPPWGAGYVDYSKQVQPVLDKFCVKCHNGPAPDGGINLSGDKTRFYNMSYEALVFNGFVEHYYLFDGPNGTFPAMKSGSWVSKLTKLLDEKHEGVDVDPNGRRAIYAWIDSNVPYYGTWEMTRPHSIGGRDAFMRPGDGDPLRPVYFPWVEKYRKFVKENSIAIYDIDTFGRISKHDHPGTAAIMINFTHPEWSPILYRNLAKKAGGLADNRAALFPSQDDPKFKQLLTILRDAKQSLKSVPRIDMLGAEPIPQVRDFGKTFR